MTVPFWLLLLVLGTVPLTPARLRRAVLAGLLLAVTVFSVQARLLPRRAEWRAAVTMVQRQAPANAFVVLHAGFNRAVWDYYAPHWKGEVYATAAPPPGRSWDDEAREMVQRAEGRPVWLVLGGWGITDPHFALYPALAAHAEKERVVHFRDVAVV